MNAAAEGGLGTSSAPRMHFQDEKLDYYLMCFLGYGTYGGAQLGECLTVASQVREEDPQSWVEEWTKMARRVEVYALEALDRGYLVSARETYLRAFTYYRAALVGLHLKEWRFYDTWEDMRSCFRIAAALFNPPIQQVEIPFEGRSLPGYYLRAEDGGAPRPALVVVGGSDMFVEELYFWAGAPGARRGYNVLLVELPGQGGSPFDGLHSAADMDLPMEAVLDYIVRRPDVDSERLALFGVGSAGAHVAARAATLDSRVAGCVLDPPIMDLYTIMSGDLYGTWPAASLTSHPDACPNAFSEILGERLAWEAGVAQAAGALAIVKDAKLNDLVAGIGCPVLCLAGEGESDAVMSQALEFYDALVAPKQMRIFGPEDGTSARCMADNLGLMHQTMFDWLGEVFAHWPGGEEW